jgi:tetratricopeptide (TPR) repeat protein
VFEALDDDRALGRTWFTVGFVRGGFWLQNAEYEAAAERALHHYRRAGWPTATCLQAVAAALFYGPRPVEEGLARIEELLATEATERAGEMHLRLWGAGLHALRGEVDVARAAVTTATDTFGDLGQPITVATACAFIAGFTEMLAGEFAAAERILRDSCDVLEERGEWAAVATRASEVANALCAQGRFAEARQWIETARRHSADDDLGAEFLWRSVLAKLTAEAGDADEAELLAREAVELADRTDALNQRADVRADLAYVLRVAQRSDEAEAAARDAAALYAQKGNVAGAALARRWSSGTGVA